MIAVVSALKGEYSTSKVPVLYTGIGKVISAIALTNFICNNPDITHYINFGTAGGIKSNKGELVECTKFTNGEVAINYNPKIHDDKTINISDRGGHVVCFDTFKTNIDTNQEWDCVDMESYSLASVCKWFNKKFSCYKYISDKVGEDSQLDTWEENLNNGSIAFNNILNKFL